MPKGWRREQSQDRFFRRAKAEGYRARSAYKLLEIDRRFRLLRPGATVLDLGAAPGSWSQVAAQAVGAAGRVVAVDLQPVSPLPGVTTLVGDIADPTVLAQIAATLPGGADLVLSDVSPAISGIAIADHARSIALAEASLAAALRFLKPGGAFVVKVFQGEDFARFVASLKPHFAAVHVANPEATRRESNERYVVGLKRGSIVPSPVTQPFPVRVQGRTGRDCSEGSAERAAEANVQPSPTRGSHRYRTYLSRARCFGSALALPSLRGG